MCVERRVLFSAECNINTPNLSLPLPIKTHLSAVKRSGKKIKLHAVADVVAVTVDFSGETPHTHTYTHSHARIHHLLFMLKC